MRPKMISEVLDLALKVRRNGGRFNPLFTGDAGIGKSEICQMWAKSQGENFGFIDLRPAYMENTDFIGLPFVFKDTEGRERSIFALPEFWPVGGEGLLLIEEPNRANQSVLNCMMQILTDRKVGNYTLPEGWIIAAAINPDNSSYTVNSMDTALYNRFEEYEVKYDFQDFVAFMETHKWHNNVVSFIKSGAWTFTPPGEIGNKGKYISPRTWSKINAAEHAEVAKNNDLHFETAIGVLGDFVGNSYYKFIHEQTPVSTEDILKDKKKAYEKLKKYSDVNNYRGDLISVTIENLAENYGTKITDEIVLEVAEIIPADQLTSLLQKLVIDKKSAQSLKEYVDKYPKFKDLLRRSLKRAKNEEKNKKDDVEKKK